MFVCVVCVLKARQWELQGMHKAMSFLTPNWLDFWVSSPSLFMRSPWQLLAPMQSTTKSNLPKADFSTGEFNCTTNLKVCPLPSWFIWHTPRVCMCPCLIVFYLPFQHAYAYWRLITRLGGGEMYTIYLGQGYEESASIKHWILLEYRDRLMWCLTTWISKCMMSCSNATVTRVPKTTYSVCTAAGVLHCSCWCSALHALSGLSSLMEA